MTEHIAAISSEARNRKHWFSEIFYRKEGYKRTLVKRRYQALAAILFAISYAAFLFQSPATLPKREESSFAGSQNIPPAAVEDSLAQRMYQALSGPKSKEKNEKRKSGKTRAVPTYPGPQLVSRPVLPIPEGTLIAVRLITGASDGPVRAQVPRNITINGENVLEAGTVLVGTGNSGEERLNIQFVRMVFKNGNSQTIHAIAFDPEDKLPGLKGSRLGNRATKIAGSIGLNFVGGMSEGLEETTVQSGVGVRSSTLKNALLNGASRTAIEESQNLMASLKDQKPVITVPPGKEVLVSFEGN